METIPPALPSCAAPLSTGPEISTETRYVAVAGNIGAGKSSLVEFLCRRYGFVPYFEPNDRNPYLDDFYGDMARYAFHSQIYFLGAKYRIHRQLDVCGHDVIQDRTIWEDAEIFVEHLHRGGQMDARDYQTYRTIYESIRDVLRPPDLLIYLRCNTRTTRRRIRQRGREAEQDIPASYIRKLQSLYDEWIARYNLSQTITIPTDKLDYVTDLVDRHELLTLVEDHFC